jgi:hypothetical protein
VKVNFLMTRKFYLIMIAALILSACSDSPQPTPPTAPAAAPTLVPTIVRAAVQATQLGLFPLQEAMYFFAYRDGANQLLHGDQRYTLTFKHGELPPLREFGFWSLTMYNDISLLVENPIDRYSIRPDSPGLTFADDGSLTLYLQADRPVGVPESNWLPAPRGAFNVALRTYLPQETVVNGTWFPPAIQCVE